MKYLILGMFVLLTGCDNGDNKPFACDGKVRQIDTNLVRVDCNDGQSFNIKAGKYWITIERSDK